MVGRIARAPRCGPVADWGCGDSSRSNMPYTVALVRLLSDCHARRAEGVSSVRVRLGILLLPLLAKRHARYITSVTDIDMKNR